MNLEIEKALVFSTAHISAETATALTNSVSDTTETGLIVYSKGDVGWLIYVHPVMTLNQKYLPNNLPDELGRLIAIAQENDCVWLMLDRDGKQMDELPTFDW